MALILAEAVALFMVGRLAGDLARVSGLFYVGLYFRALYGSPRHVATVTVAFVAALAVATVAPHPEAASNLARLPGDAMGLTLTAVAMGVVQTMMGRYEQALVRERALREDLHRRRSDARFQALVQHASDVVAVIDVGGTLQYLTPSLTTVFGYQPDALMGTPLGDWLHPEYAAGAPGLLAAVAAARRGRPMLPSPGA